MGSKIRKLALGTYEENVSRTYNWRITITKFPNGIRNLIKENYPKLYERIGGDSASDSLLLPLDAFCTSLSIPRMSPDTISVPIGNSGVEVAGVFSFFNFTGEFIIDANFDFRKVFELWGVYSNRVNGYHNYTGNLKFEKLSSNPDGSKKVVARYNIPKCWAKEVSVLPNDSAGAISNFSVMFSAIDFVNEDT